MSERTHFWLRVVALTAILFAEFGPRLWTGSPQATVSTASVAVAR
jgi:hypothetical protein